ncbi:hypothetical protein [Nocardia terpenica]|uniref:hypothetical protein n=1 Tax=Nocardia terpenica TaxID=455432 RepID=UPI000AB0D045|nr:hypothetical protein [Nocardia terpenica]NQE89951.1 hypothetical protein [Nocardia terpenica]
MGKCRVGDVGRIPAANLVAAVGLGELAKDLAFLDHPELADRVRAILAQLGYAARAVEGAPL